MNDLKLRNMVVATLAAALSVTCLGTLQAQSMPINGNSSTKKDPGATSPSAATVAPGTTQAKPAKTTQAQPGGKPAASGKKPETAAAGNIVELAAGNSKFSTLVAAVKAAGMEKVLASTGPYTIFAPTNEAFAKLPKGALASLLKPENKAVLQQVLKYHVIAGKVMAADVKSGNVKTAEGSSLKVVAGNGGVTINEAKVVKADNTASNGVIHAIDTVLLPPSLTSRK
jgi:uncharacterized surface protein with fasciclin (FAS1) repeats